MILATTNPSRGRGTLMLGLLVVFGILLTIFSVVSSMHWVLAAFAVVAIIGMAQSAFFPLINSLLIEAAPENMRGRIMGVLSLDRAMMAFGGAAAGILSDQIGVQISQIIFGMGCVITAVVMYVSYPPLRRIE